MRRLRSNLILLTLCLLSSLTAGASPQLYNLDIKVVLQKSGDALITETRTMLIDGEGTECYIVIGNLNGSQLRDVSVSDETGRQYDFIDSWDVDRSRSYKAGKCGLVTTRSGYELCWGLGDSGQRTYVTKYTVTGLVRGYSDADGFNYMFVAQGINPSPEHVKVTISSADSTAFSLDNTGIWGFRYRGDVTFQHDNIVAESSEPFSSQSAMIVMCRFEKGLFSPEVTCDGSFEEVKQRAFDGSDYDDDDLTKEDILTIIALIIGFVFFPLLILVGYIIYVWRARRKVMKDLGWYRDIPYGGNLQQTNNVLNAYKYFSTDYNNLLSACILKLINLGAITIESTPTKQNFVIHDLKNMDRQPRLLKIVHQIFRDAAGNDTVLEPKELKSYMKSSYNQNITDAFINTLHTKTSISQYKNETEEVRQVFGLKKYLMDFSLLDERHVAEVSLWKDYMIYATLFGIADQVIKDMRKINPEYFNMDQVARQMADDYTLPMIYSTLHSSTSRAATSKAEREARASGGGGGSSWGGGGGFSGGGGGGGVR